MAKCEAVAAYNTKSGFLGLTPHPKSDENTGFVITIGGARIYQAGDTDFVPEMRTITNIIAALLPIGGGGLTMDPDQAAKAVNAIKPRIAIPMHFNPDDKAAIRKFVESADTNIQTKVMQKDY